MASTAETFSQSTWAVVAGCDSFAAPELRALSSPVADARRLAAALIAPSGCAVPAAQVRCLPASGGSVRRNELLDALGEAVRSASFGGVLIVYFAGHGLRRDGRFYLCTSDTEVARLDDTALSSADLQRLFGALAARGLLVILDCCHGAGFAESAPDVFRQLERGDFRILLSASRAGQESWELREGRGTLFSRHLIASVEGREQPGDRAGQIYFTDLLRHLRDRVLEDLEALDPTLAQEPVFAGVFSRDPLLFVHRQLTLAQLEVRTSRYSREYLRRLLWRLLAAGSAAALFVLGSLYSYVEQHEFAQTAGSGIALYVGHPHLRVFGFPKPLGALDLGPGAVVEGSPLQREGGFLVAPLSQPALPRVAAQLQPEFRALFDAWQGRRDEALRELRYWLGTGAPPTGDYAAAAVELFGQVAEPADLPALAGLLGASQPDVRQAALLGVLRLDRQAGLKAAPRIIGLDVAESSRVLRALRGPCDETAARFLGARLADRSGPSSLEEVLDASLRLGCWLPLPDIVIRVLDENEPDHRRDLALYGSVAFGERFGEEVKKLLAAARGHVHTAAAAERTGHLLAAVREMPGQACLEEEASWFWNAPSPWLRDEALVTVLHLCGARAWPQIERQVADRSALARPAVEPELLRLGLRDPRTLLAAAGRGDRGASLLVLLDAAAGLDPVRLTPILVQLLDHTESAVRERVLRLLRRAAAPSGPALRFLADRERGVRMEAFRWLWRDQPQRAFEELLRQMGDESTEFAPELLAELPLAEADLAALRPLLRGTPLQRDHAASALVARVGAAEAVALLDAGDPRVRRAAADYVGLRPDLPAIVDGLAAAARRQPDRPHGVESPLEQAAARRDFAAELAKVPPRARPWRADLLRRAQSPPAGLGLWLKRVAGAERP